MAIRYSRSLFVAEQLAFEQRLGDGGAVDRQERSGGPAAEVADRSGHHFLAGAGLAEDQDRRVQGATRPII